MIDLRTPFTRTVRSPRNGADEAVAHGGRFSRSSGA